MSSRELQQFLNVHVPGKGYHAFDGEIELYTEKGLSFECPCGESHPVTATVAVLDFPLENKGLYICPSNKRVFILVKATGVFSVKGLKTIATYEAENDEVQHQIMTTLESREKRD